MADRLAASMGCKGVAMNGDSQPMSSTLAELLRVTARQHGERTALRVLASDSGATVGAVAVELTWAAVDAAVDRVASGLLAAGVAPGDRVALVLSNLGLIHVNRSWGRTAWRGSAGSNRQFGWIVLGTLVVLGAVLGLPGVSRLFYFATPEPLLLGAALGVAALGMAWFELVKRALGRPRKNAW